MLNSLNDIYSYGSYKTMTCCMTVPLIIAGKFLATRMSIFFEHLVNDHFPNRATPVEDSIEIIDNRLRKRHNRGLHQSYNYDALCDKALVTQTIERMLEDEISSDDFNSTVEQILSTPNMKLVRAIPSPSKRLIESTVTKQSQILPVASPELALQESVDLNSSEKVDDTSEVEDFVDNQDSILLEDRKESKRLDIEDFELL